MGFKSEPSPPLLPHLYASLNGKPKDLKWGPLKEAAFCNAKNALSTAAASTFLVPHAPLLLSSNATDVAIGVVLKQAVNGSATPNPPPPPAFSRKLFKAESGCTIFDRELVSLHLAARHFCRLLEGLPPSHHLH
ncbi:uncharacterized protein [Palaemon carinicauda]|uniref:uncharacterized protein n=1 Tax=Palaemon carinicauda TaxID=392227 RepID=UPI0035B654BB